MNVCGLDMPAEIDDNLKKKDLVQKYDTAGLPIN